VPAMRMRRVARAAQYGISARKSSRRYFYRVRAEPVARNGAVFKPKEGRFCHVRAARDDTRRGALERECTRVSAQRFRLRARRY